MKHEIEKLAQEGVDAMKRQRQAKLTGFFLYCVTTLIIAIAACLLLRTSVSVKAQVQDEDWPFYGEMLQGHAIRR